MGNILLASCAQDCFVRVWKISEKRDVTEIDPYSELKLKEKLFSIPSGKGCRGNTASIGQLLSYRDLMAWLQIHRDC